MVVFVGVCAQYGGSPRTYDESDPDGFSKKFPPTLEPLRPGSGPSEDALQAITASGQPIPATNLLAITVKAQGTVMEIQMTVTNANRLIITSYDSQNRRIGAEDVSVPSRELSSLMSSR